MTLWRITGHKFVAGLVVREGVVVEAAPILRGSLGRRWSEVKDYARRRGWRGEVVARRDDSEDRP